MSKPPSSRGGSQDTTTSRDAGATVTSRGAEGGAELRGMTGSVSFEGAPAPMALRADTMKVTGTALARPLATHVVEGASMSNTAPPGRARTR